MDKRVLAIEIARQLAEPENIPYEWGGNDPIEGGLDCSGLIRFVLRIVGVIPFSIDMRARDFYRSFREKTVPEPYYGCLAFYGPDLVDIKHVVFCLDKKMAVGATTFEDYSGVQEHPIHYREDLVAIVDPFL